VSGGGEPASAGYHAARACSMGDTDRRGRKSRNSALLMAAAARAMA